MKYGNIIIGSLGFVFILGYILLFSKQFTYDEPYYLSNLEIINSFGLGKGFLENMKGPAGPLHAYVHYFSLPIVQGNVVYTRLINVFFVLGISFSLYYLLKMINPQRATTSLLLFTIPMIYPCMGMALTEIPAMFFFTLSLFFITLIFTQKGKISSQKELLIFLLAGLLLSIAVTGRQPYLVCVGGLLPFFFTSKTFNKKIGIVVFTLATILLPSYLFFTWGGLAPTIGGAVAQKEFIKPIHFFLGLGYAFMIMLILTPHFFIKPVKKLFLTYSIVFPVAFLICFLTKFTFLVSRTNLEKIFPEFFLEYVGYFTAAALITIGIYFLHSLIHRTYENRANQVYLIFALMLVFLLFSNIKVTHLFSSRYVFQAAPLFVILASFSYKKSIITFILHIVGILIGISSLLNYY